MIVDHVNEHIKATVPKLCDIFSVSSATIRNDLRTLEGAGLLKRTHGGAISCKSVNYEINSYERASERVEQKIQIATKAVAFIKEGGHHRIRYGNYYIRTCKAPRPISGSYSRYKRFTDRLFS